MTKTSDKQTQTAIIGGGCFWCVEAAYENLPGIKSVISGYAGGESKNPNYREVTSGHSGHAEVVKIDFDSRKISFRKIIDRFWHAHDPTTLNRQGADVGPQYRSIILCLNDEQKKIAIASRDEYQKKISKKIVTEINSITLNEFYPAEKYHQDFARNNPNHPYVQAVIKPKLEKLEKLKKQAE